MPSHDEDDGDKIKKKATRYKRFAYSVETFYRSKMRRATNHEKLRVIVCRLKRRQNVSQRHNSLSMNRLLSESGLHWRHAMFGITDISNNLIDKKKIVVCNDQSD